jgi:hypothetical protein
VTAIRTHLWLLRNDQGRGYIQKSEIGTLLILDPLDCRKWTVEGLSRQGTSAFFESNVADFMVETLTIKSSSWQVYKRGIQKHLVRGLKTESLMALLPMQNSCERQVIARRKETRRSQP